jgi:TPR repeat protein
MNLVIARRGLVSLFWVLAAIASPQVSAQMSQEELRTFEDNKAKAIQGDGQAAYVVSTAYLSGKAVPDDKAEALALCLSSAGNMGNLPYLFQRVDFKKLFGGMSDDLILKGIRRSFEIKKAGLSLRRFEGNFGHEGTPGPWHGYGMPGILDEIYNSIDAKGRIEGYRERVSREPSSGSLHTLASAISESEPSFSGKLAAAKAESRKLRLAALEMARANPSGASLEDIYTIAGAYSSGTEGFPVDKAEAGRWRELAIKKVSEESSQHLIRNLIYTYEHGNYGFPVDTAEANKWRIRWVELMRKKAEAGGLSDWRELAEFLEESPSFVGQAGGPGIGGSVWSERYLMFQRLKAERGDIGAVDALIGFYASHGFRWGRKSWTDVEHDGREHLRWLTFAFDKFKRPSDAIALAKIYADGLNYGMELYDKRRFSSRNDYVQELARSYLAEVIKKAETGSCRDKFMLALIKDGPGGGGLSASWSSDYADITAIQLVQKFEFLNLAFPLLGYDSQGNPFGGSAERDFARMSEKVTEMSARDLYLDYLKAFDSQDFTKNGFLFKVEEVVQPNGDVWESYEPYRFNDFGVKMAVLSRLAVMDDKVAADYAMTKGVAKDETLALRWRMELIKLGDLPSLLDLAKRYDQGSGVPVDKVRSYAYAFLSGARYPQEAVTSPFGEGLQPRSDDKELEAYFKLSAEQKKEAMAIAKDFIKDFHDRMTRIAQGAHDGFKAEQLRVWKRRFEADLKAAQRGDAKAQVNLGYAFHFGQGVASDPAQAVKWFRQAADQGNSDGQRALGYCYQDGTGVAKDEISAFAYWSLAGAKDAEARGKLVDLEKRMTPTALSLGRQRSTELHREIEAKIAAKKPGK